MNIRDKMDQNVREESIERDYADLQKSFGQEWLVAVRLTMPNSNRNCKEISLRNLTI